MTPRPHDALFKSGFEEPAAAARLLRELLPAAIRKAVAWGTLRREHGSFVDAKLADRHCDLLFRARLRAGRPGHVFFLLEHQSTRDPAMPLRAIAYQVQIWERCRKERRRDRLPPVVAVLVSHAPGGWTAPCSLEELFEPAVLAIPGLAPLVPRCSMVVLDLARLSDAELQARSLPALQELTLWLLRDARAPARLLASFDAWAPIMRKTGQGRPGLDARNVLIGYMYKVVGPRRHAQLDAKVRALGAGIKEDIMNLTDLFREEGRAKGRAEGMAEGLAKGRIAQLRRLLSIKFGTLDAASEACLRTATSRELDRYSRRLLTAASLAEVFEGRARRRAPRPRPRGSRRVRPGRA